jgi:hypothetical protein
MASINAARAEFGSAPFAPAEFLAQMAGQVAGPASAMGNCWAPAL